MQNRSSALRLGSVRSQPGLLVLLRRLRPEAPEVALDVTGAVAAESGPVVVRLAENLCSRSLGALVMGVGVVDDHVDPALASVAAVQILGPLGFDHDHAVAVLDRGAIDLVVASLLDTVPLEPERSFEPCDRGSDGAICQVRVDTPRPRRRQSAASPVNAPTTW